MNPQLAMEWLLDHAEDADASLDAPVTAESLSSMLTSVSRRAPPPARGPVAEDPAVSVTISFVLNYLACTTLTRNGIPCCFCCTSVKSNK